MSEQPSSAELTEENDAIVDELSTQRLPFAFARRLGVMIDDRASPLLCHTPTATMDAILEARRFYGQPLPLKLLEQSQFDLQLTELYQQDSSEAQQLMEDIGKDDDLTSLADELPETEDLLDADDDAPIIRLINALLSESIKLGASDIHVETYEKELVVRFRVDGVLREVLKQQRKIASLLVSRIKVMAKLDIAEKRVPQDGRISLRIGGRAVDVRVSTMPSSRGERVVMRLLDKNQSVLNLEQLGMSQSIRDRYNVLIRRPHGILLVTGPTGSGKSTTLYAGLTDINSRDRNILTVEDPIEYELEGIGQTQVNAKVDMTFARGLRAILRQDPDVVMVGEIRDLETGQIAVQASLTGHLVMSTLHTNTASGAVTRLQDMGVEPFLVSSSLLGVLAQRLVRTLCPDCKQPYHANARELELLARQPDEQVTLYKPAGCETCNHGGYKGRTGIHELLEVDDEIRELIHTGRGELAIEKYLRTVTPSIREDGFSKVLAGRTTLEEVMRVTREE
ncbi:type II secretion system ATPase GspE [Ferrimonas lipolytica]|nr:type II secretion system ATPase GspE [Ferrimonas lipolytica]